VRRACAGEGDILLLDSRVLTLSLPLFLPLPLFFSPSASLLLGLPLFVSVYVSIDLHDNANLSPSQPQHQLKNNTHTHTHTHTYTYTQSSRFGLLVIQRVRDVRYCDLDLELARIENLQSAEELQKVLLKFYPDISDEDMVRMCVSYTCAHV